MDSSDSNPWITGIGCLLLAVIGIAQAVAGFIGLEYQFGWIGLTISSFLAIIGIQFPFTIGTFICCVYVWGWSWPFALLFTLPGLIFLLPSAMAAVVSLLPWNSIYRKKNCAPRAEAVKDSENYLNIQKSQSMNDGDSVKSIAAESIFEQPEQESEYVYGDSNGSIATEDSSHENLEISASFSYPQVKEDAPQKPFGIGGALAVFVFILVSQPFFIFQLIIEYDDYRKSVTYFPELIYPVYIGFIRFAISASIAYVSGLIISTGTKKGRRTANFCLCVNFSLVALETLFVVAFVSSIPDSSDLIFKSIAFGVVPSGIWISVWLLYLNVSKRCKNSYNSIRPIPPMSSFLWKIYVFILGLFLIFGYIGVYNNIIKLREAIGDEFLLKSSGQETADPKTGSAIEGWVPSKRQPNATPPLPEIAP